MGLADVPGAAESELVKVKSPIARSAFHLTAGRQLGTIPPRTQAETNTNQPETGKKEETK
ncbi:MAG: hypothetical protein QGH94_17995, partial [Phycisphaerae bacterium]|jgi:hypothetical protein|nr:hypothetical protein [Phycisphaerae bacterium]